MTGSDSRAAQGTLVPAGHPRSEHHGVPWPRGHAVGRVHHGSQPSVHRRALGTQVRRPCHQRRVREYRRPSRCRARRFPGRHRPRGRSRSCRIRRTHRMGLLGPRASRGRHDPSRGCARRQDRGDVRRRQRTERHADHRRPVLRRCGAPSPAALLRGSGRQPHVRGTAHRTAPWYHPGPPGTRGRRSRRHDLELPSDHRLLQGGPGSGGRLHARPQAGSADGPRLGAAGAGGRGSGHPGRRDQHRPGRPGDRRVSGLPSWHRQGVVHRIHQGGATSRRRMRRVAAAGDPGTGRRVRRRRSRGRRPRRERGTVLHGQPAEQRSDLLREHQDPGPAQQVLGSGRVLYGDGP